jgi:hypothetical protein
MGIGLSGYTLDWPNGSSLISRTIYNESEIQGREVTVARKQRVSAGQRVAYDLSADTVAVRAYPSGTTGIDVGKGGRKLWSQRSGGSPAPDDSAPVVGRFEWTPGEGQWEVWVFTAPRQPGTLNPIHPLAGQRVIEKFFQPFQDHAPNRSAAGLNYFFHDELKFGVGDRVWADDLAEQFQRRKGYDLFEALPAMFQDVGPLTVKYRLDFMDVKMQLCQQRYFVPIFQWHWERGKIYGCDQGSRGRDPLEFGDYFRAIRWYTAPGHDTPGGRADLIKGKVSSSIAHLYRRPRVWLEGYHSLGWGATPENLMFATRKNYLYGCNLLNLHGLYYTTHGSFWEWAPPCYHFRMPYWQHMGVFLKYFERLSYLMSQGVHQCDIAVMYPVAPGQAGLGGQEATEAAFTAGTALASQGYDFIFLDFESLARAEIRDKRLHVADASYGVLVLPAMRAIRWSTLQKARAFYRAGGVVIAGGALPEASDHAGHDDPQLEAVVRELFGATASEAASGQFPAVQRSAAGGIGIALLSNEHLPGRSDHVDQLHGGGAPEQVWAQLVDWCQEHVPRDTNGPPTIQATHRKVGPRDVYLVMGAPKNSVVEFRAKDRVELWDPWTGKNEPLRVIGQTPAGTKVELPLEEYEAQVVVFTPGEVHVNPPPCAEQPTQKMVLQGDWQFELQPTMNNRFGDFRLPAVNKFIGAEARIFRHAIEHADATGWCSADFDDSSWQRATYDFGPQFWLLGPLPADRGAAGLDAELAQLARIDPRAAIRIAGQPYPWRPYQMSWRMGLQGDPGHQGWHGLKKNVTDHFLCLGKPAGALNELKYQPEPAGSRYYLWTSATVDHPTTAQFVTSGHQEGEKPHSSEVLIPAAVYLNGSHVGDLSKPVSLRAGANPILVRYDHAGRGYFVVKRKGTVAQPARRTPLAMNWLDDPSVVRFDVFAGARPAEWFRFISPPGLLALRVTAKGSVEAWANGQPMRVAGPGRFVPSAPLSHAAVVALRVVPQTGFCGAAVFPEPIRLGCGPGLTTLGDWSKSGALECYSGGAWYRKTVSLSAEQVCGQVTLDLGKVVATAEVHVNGQLAGTRVAPPWRVDVSKQVRLGKNRIEVLVFNTLANHYMTIPTRYRGDPTSGLLGPVTLETR